MALSEAARVAADKLARNPEFLRAVRKWREDWDHPAVGVEIDEQASDGQHVVFTVRVPLQAVELTFVVGGTADVGGGGQDGDDSG